MHCVLPPDEADVLLAREEDAEDDEADRDELVALLLAALLEAALDALADEAAEPLPPSLPPPPPQAGSRAATPRQPRRSSIARRSASGAGSGLFIFLSWVNVVFAHRIEPAGRRKASTRQCKSAQKRVMLLTYARSLRRKAVGLRRSGV